MNFVLQSFYGMANIHDCVVIVLILSVKYSSFPIYLYVTYATYVIWTHIFIIPLKCHGGGGSENSINEITYYLMIW